MRQAEDSDASHNDDGSVRWVFREPGCSLEESASPRARSQLHPLTAAPASCARVARPPARARAAERNATAATVYCCPAGQRIDNGKCVASARSVAVACTARAGPRLARARVPPPSSTREVFCCPEGQRIRTANAWTRARPITSFYTDILHRAPAPEWLARHVNGGLPPRRSESPSRRPRSTRPRQQGLQGVPRPRGRGRRARQLNDHLVRGRALDWVWEQIRTSEEARRKNGGQPPR